jgi:hypothetical protein
MKWNGHADDATPAEVTAEDVSEEASGTGVPWWLIVLALVALVAALVIGGRVVWVLSGLIFPPDPPKPPGVALIHHTSTMHGSDEWQYHLALDACATAAFYVEHGGTCEMQPGHCLGDATGKAAQRSALAAVCTGETTFSTFVMRWDAEVYAYEDYTRIMLSREIPWARTNNPSP